MYKVIYYDYKGELTVMTFAYYYQAESFADGIPSFRFIKIELPKELEQHETGESRN